MYEQFTWLVLYESVRFKKIISTQEIESQSNYNNCLTPLTELFSKNVFGHAYIDFFTKLHENIQELIRMFEVSK